MASRTARVRGPLAAFLAAVLTLGLVVVAATSASADVWDDRRAAAEARAKAAASAAERIEHELEGTKTAIVQAAVELIRRAWNESEREAAVEEASDAGLDMIGQAPAMQEVFRAIGRLSQSNVTVLITGESGTGKE